MQKQITCTRKNFVRILGGLVAGFFGWMWLRLGEEQANRESRLEFRHNEELPMGVTLFGKYYLVRNEQNVRAFSTVCTHAGCRIGKGGAGAVQCGCHGSQFDAASGQPLRGPAIRPLEQFECNLDRANKQWVVTLKNANTAPA